MCTGAEEEEEEEEEREERRRPQTEACGCAARWARSVECAEGERT
jgi:hypothetical protein